MSALRLFRLAVAGLLALGMSLLIAPAASAQYGGTATVVLSATSVRAGDDITVNGTGCAPGETVLADLEGFDTASVVADENGSSSFTIETEGLDAGTYTVTLTCADSGAVASANFTVEAANQGSGQPGTGGDEDDNDNGGNNDGDNNDNGGAMSGNGSNGSDGSNGGSNNASGGSSDDLAFTGSSAVVPMALGGGVLLAAGVGALALSRNRRTES